MKTRVVWIHSGGWRTEAAISYIGVHNAWSFAAAGVESHLLMPTKAVDPQPEAGLAAHYGLAPHPLLHLHLSTATRRWWHWRHPYYTEGEALVRSLHARHPEERLIVLTREQRFLPALARLARLPGVITLFEPHFFFVDQQWRGAPVSRGDARRGRLERACLPRIHGLVCITAEQAAHYRTALPGIRTLDAPLGVKTLPDALQCQPAWRHRRQLAYIGHLHGYKGIDALVGLGQQLAEAGLEVTLFGGKPDEVAARKAECAARGVTALSWHAFLPPAAVFPALAEVASVGIVALEDTYYNRNLTCPVKALDFLALGLPVVASDLPSTREVLGQAGVYFAPGNMNDMLHKVRQLLDDPAAYQGAASASRQRAAELAWKERAGRILAFAATLAD